MATINAIETTYAGCRFRSRLEARWAVFFDKLGIDWRYEPQGYLVDGRPYLPDFWLESLSLWVEVKGRLDRDDLAKVAAAAGPAGLPFYLGEDSGRPCDMDFPVAGWLDVAVPFVRRLLILGDIPHTEDEWVHPLLSLANGRHVVEQPCAWWTTNRGFRLVQVDRPLPLGADPSIMMPHGMPYAPLRRNHKVADAYQSARSARFEHGERG